MFYHFGPFFGLSLPDDPETQNFEKLKKTLGDIIFCAVCTKKAKNDSDMVYGSWDIECSRQKFFSFWTILCPFNPPPPAPHLP